MSVMSDSRAQQCTPEKVNATQFPFTNFPCTQTGVAAWHVVMFCKRRNKGWQPFSTKEFEIYYQKDHDDYLKLKALVEESYLLLQGDKYVVTDKFLEQFCSLDKLN